MYRWLGGMAHGFDVVAMQIVDESGMVAEPPA